MTVVIVSIVVALIIILILDFLKERNERIQAQNEELIQTLEKLAGEKKIKVRKIELDERETNGKNK